MAVFQVNPISRDVRIALDQNMTSDKLVEIGDVDTLSLNDIIRSKIEDAVKRVHSEAPYYLLDGGNNLGESIYWNEGKNTGWILLPDNFMRLVVFQMDDWERAVYHAISEDDPEYELQSSKFKGIRGTPQRPVCAIAVRPEGRALEFYSCKSPQAQISRGVYLPYPHIDETDGINICKRCYEAVIYTIASLVLVTYGDTDKSTNFTELAKSTLI